MLSQTLVVQRKFIYSEVSEFTKSKYNTPSVKFFDLDYMSNSNNDLEPVAFKNYPKLKALKLSLMKLPNVAFARMTGSGSTILAYFKTKKTCDIAYKELKKRYKNYWCIVSKTI